jgi:hypothetical protein
VNLFEVLTKRAGDGLGSETETGVWGLFGVQGDLDLCLRGVPGTGRLQFFCSMRVEVGVGWGGVGVEEGGEGGIECLRVPLTCDGGAKEVGEVTRGDPARRKAPEHYRRATSGGGLLVGRGVGYDPLACKV